MPSQRPDLIPAHYNDLDASLQETWRLLSRAAADRRAPMHTPAVASIGLDGRPKVRVVVLRHADPFQRLIRFHTDRRSAKLAEFAANSATQILAYDAGQKVQLRLSGTAAAHVDDETARAAWRASQPQSQLCYRQVTAPGSIAAPPIEAQQVADHDGAQNFSAVVVAIDEIEWLYLAAAGHRRARFSWRSGNLESRWLAP
ncbi:MAG: pyridoxamine 5'-phosphate oxidase family protein [Hyphomicrobium sp.]